MTLRLISILALLAGASALPGAEHKATPPAPAPAPATKTPANAPAANRPANAVQPAARPSTITPTTGFDAFRTISERNIFNPNRTGPRRERTEDARPRVDIISLVGTMDSDRGLVAFFDGSSPSYRKTLRVGESIEQFKVVKIARYHIDVEHGGKTFSVRVGQQLRRPEGAEWTVVGEDIARLEAQTQAAAAAAVPEISAAASDIERRMRERRQQATKN